MDRGPRLYSRAPWWLPDADLIGKGEPELTRDLRHEKHIGLLVQGTHDPSLVLGILAIRCERGGPHQEIPIGVAIADALVLIDTDSVPVQQSNRLARWRDDEEWR